MITVQIRCTYPAYLKSEPTQVRFRLSPEYKCRTVAEAHQLIERLRTSYEYFELQPDTDDPPLPFWSDTIEDVVVR